MTDQLRYKRNRSVGGHGSEQTSWKVGKDENSVEWDAPTKEARGADFGLVIFFRNISIVYFNPCKLASSSHEGLLFHSFFFFIYSAPRSPFSRQLVSIFLNIFLPRIFQSQVVSFPVLYLLSALFPLLHTCKLPGYQLSTFVPFHVFFLFPFSFST